MSSEQLWQTLKMFYPTVEWTNVETGNGRKDRQMKVCNMHLCKLFLLFLLKILKYGLVMQFFLIDMSKSLKNLINICPQKSDSHRSQCNNNFF